MFLFYIYLYFIFIYFYKSFQNKYLSFFLIIYLLLLNNKEKRPKISIFLPTYNKEQYIQKNIQIIQNQTLKDIEIVVVNDFSSDMTLNILMDLAKIDNRIKIVNNDKNHGLLYSRAMGILNSSGEYIMNVDPDDQLENNDNLEYLYNITKLFNVDIISFNFYDQKRNKIFKCKNRNKIEKQPELFYSIFGKNNVIKDFFIWNKLVKRKIFLKAYQDFKEAIYNGKWNYFEDDIWNILVNRYAKSKLCVNKLIYNYTYNKDSLMSKRYGLIEFYNLLYRHQMYKKIFTTKADKKYLFAEYFFLFNRLKRKVNHLLIINDKIINNQINNIFMNFLQEGKCTRKEKKKINKFLKLIKVL